MCLGMPGQVVALGEEVAQIATVEVDGVRREASLAMLDDVAVGDWVLIHLGFAMAKIDEEEARETTAFLHSLAEQP